MKNSGIIEVKRNVIENLLHSKKEDLPYSKTVCAICKKWKPLVALGYYEEETWVCEECFDKLTGGAYD